MEPETTDGADGVPNIERMFHINRMSMMTFNCAIDDLVIEINLIIKSKQTIKSNKNVPNYRWWMNLGLHRNMQPGDCANIRSLIDTV